MVAEKNETIETKEHDITITSDFVLGSTDKHEKEKQHAQLLNIDIVNNAGISFDTYLNINEIQKDTNEQVIARYTKIKDDEEKVKVAFGMVDASGVFYFYDNDVKVAMRDTEISGKPLNRKQRMLQLNKLMNVMVDEIVSDGEDTTVYVSVKKIREKMYEGDRDKLRKVINDAKGAVKVPAKVVFIHFYGKYAILDLGGLGLFAYLKIGEWSHAYTSNLKNFVKVGEIIEVAAYKPITEKPTMDFSRVQKRVGNNPMEFECSRRVLHDNPWKDIDERIGIDDMITVKCVDKLDGYFFAVNENFPEINFFCLYPSDLNKRVRPDVIKLGGMYTCRVRKVDKNERQLRIKLLDPGAVINGG